MGFTFVNLGLHPIIDGTEAERLRLIFKAVKKENVVQEAVAIAEEMAATSSTATRAVLRTLRSKQDIGLAAALLRESDTQAQSFASKDYAEGLKAIAEKRDPNFAAFEHYE
uniref:Enoyl-CoA hydratase n=1 Tax=Globisporangium ultimum (strain ATCC 200006 / CBS 805.95 / DAOM BR144) TaxID=431595 RepID=K3WA36_GLOUD